MPFQIVWKPSARETFDEMMADAHAAIKHRTGKGKSTKTEGLFKQVLKCVQLLSENPRHPGLHTHEFHSLEHPYDAKMKVFEAYAQNRTPGAYRVFWCYGPGRNELTIIAITPHP